MATNLTISKKCNLSAAAKEQPKASMDPTVLKSHPKSNTIITTSTAKPHPMLPDPIVASSTIQNISSHFSKLYSNHKIHACLKGPNAIPHFQEKGLNDSCVLDTSCLALTKSSSLRGRNGIADLGKESDCAKTKVKEKDKKSVIKKSHQGVIDVEKGLARQKFFEVNKLSLAEKEETKKKEFYDGKDVKKASALMSKSHESQELKKFNGVIEMERPSVSLALKGNRRKSFCCSETELADFFACTGVKVVAVDMPPFMQIHAVDCARKTYDSLEKFTSKTLAFTLKKEFDGVYGPAWHCIVGTSFGSFVTHSVGGFMYFSMDQKLHILLFKTTVQRAD